jgi:hypothetical protein
LRLSKAVVPLGIAQPDHAPEKRTTDLQTPGASSLAVTRAGECPDPQGRAAYRTIKE